MIKRPLKDITIDDIKALKENAVPESVSLDYKEDLPLKKDDDKAEFLYDVSSFANSQGGDLVYGISEGEKGSFPDELKGIAIDDSDEFVRKVFSIIRDGVEPRIARIDHKLIPVEDQRYIFIIRVDRSLNRPHMVVFKGRDRFYAREANGKFKLNVTQLRALFNSTASLRTSLMDFRKHRTLEIASGNGFVPLLPFGKMILHVIPVSAVDEETHYDLTKLINEVNLLRPLGEQYPPGVTYNFDGLISFVRREGEPSHTYLQFFRNGIIETANSRLCQPRYDKRQLDVDLVEHYLVEALSRVSQIFKLMDIPLPAAMLLTFTGISDYTIFTRRFDWFYNNKIGVDPMYFPDILVENWNIKAPQLLKPWFDTLWNAFGYEGSHNFKNGEWKLSK